MRKTNEEITKSKNYIIKKEVSLISVDDIKKTVCQFFGVYDKMIALEVWS